MNDADARLSWLDKVMIALCSLALILIFGFALAVVALVLVVW